MRRAVLAALVALSCSRETPIASTSTSTYTAEEKGTTQRPFTPSLAGSSPVSGAIARQSFASANLESVPLSFTPISDAMGATLCPHSATLEKWAREARPRYRTGYDWLPSARVNDQGCRAIIGWLSANSGLGFVDWLGRNGYQSPAAKCTYYTTIAPKAGMESVQSTIGRFEIWHRLLPEDIAVVTAPMGWNGLDPFPTAFTLGCWPDEDFMLAERAHASGVVRVAEKPKPVDPPPATICKHRETFTAAEIARLSERIDCTNSPCPVSGPRVAAIRDIISGEVYPVIGGNAIDIPYKCGTVQMGRRFTFQALAATKLIRIE